MKKVKVALIGTGNWCLQHCRVIKKHPKVEFCGILGRNKERTKKRAKLFDVPYYLDLKELIKYQKPKWTKIHLGNYLSLDVESVFWDNVKEKIIVKNGSNHLNTAKLVNQIKKKL